MVAAESWWDAHKDDLIGIVTPLVIAGVLVFVLDRFLSRRAGRLARAVTGGEGLSRDTVTRLRFARRILEALIIVVGVMAALSHVSGLEGLARTILASSAITAAVVGFAARQTVANAIAGIMLAIVQPIRIGDLVTFEGETGTVEDVGLTYTWLRTGADARILVPNEKLASGMIRNDSIRSATVSTEVSVWLAADADETRALEAIRALDVNPRLAEITAEGMRISVQGDPGPPSDRLAREAELRAGVLRALREAGVRG